jgi:hypothetical protein
MTSLTAPSAGEAAEAVAAGSADWRAAAVAVLSVRVIQGFIYWGGGSRRFFCDPSKLAPDAHSWMANKPGPYGLEAGMGAAAVVTPPPPANAAPTASSASCASPTWTARLLRPGLLPLERRH